MRYVLAFALWFALATALYAEPLDSDALPGAAVSDADLDALEGGTSETYVVSVQDLAATNTGNTVSAEVLGSGDVSIGSDAFSGFNGIGNFVVNTGHNNNLQGSISVVVVLPTGTD